MYIYIYISTIFPYFSNSFPYFSILDISQMGVTHGYPKSKIVNSAQAALATALHRGAKNAGATGASQGLKFLGHGTNVDEPVDPIT